MKKISIALIAFLGFSLCLNAQDFQSPELDVNGENELFNRVESHLDLKSANELVYLIDSIHGYEMNTESAWEGTYKIDRTYDEQGNIIGSLEKVWDKDAGAFLTASNTVWIYDSNIQERDYSLKWNAESAAWDSTTFRLYTFDGNRNKIKRIYYPWNTEANKFEALLLTYYKYDTNGALVQDSVLKWDAESSTWNNYLLITYEYTEVGLNAKQLTQKWDLTTSAWINSLIIEYKYDENNLYIEWSLKKWDITSETWIKYLLRTKTNGANGLIEEQLNQMWSVSENAYSSTQHNLYEYDDFGNLIEYIYQKWDNTNSVWKDDSKVYTFFSQHNKTDAEILEMESQIKVFPNPAQNELSVSGIEEPSTISVHDINGKLFFQRNVNSEITTIDVSNIPVGLYFLEIDNKLQKQIVKFVKQ